MNTHVVGMDNGSMEYLGRREPVKKQGEDPLAKAIASKWARLKTARQKTEALRWEAVVEFRSMSAIFDHFKISTEEEITDFGSWEQLRNGNVLFMY